MTRANQRQHSRKDANRACPEEAPLTGQREKQPRWVRPLRRLHRDLDRGLKLLDSTRRAISAATATRPIRTSRRLYRASFGLLEAQARLSSAVRGLDTITEAARQAPEQAAEVPWLLLEATQRWVNLAGELAVMSNHLYGLHTDVTAGLKSGELVPEPLEPAAARRPRIIVTPRIISARAFLLHRRKSALDRIASIPARRRPAARISSTDAPRRISRGRAPPPSASTCRL